MFRLLGSMLILALLALNWWLPSSPMGRRGAEMEVRADVEQAVLAVGERVPDIEFMTIDGSNLRLADFRGKPLTQG